MITLPHNWIPRDYQGPVWKFLERGGRRACLTWHRRAGKDDVCLHWAAVSAMQRVGNYWHLLPEQEQARKALWRAIDPHSGLRRIDAAFPPQIRRQTREAEMSIELINGSTWQLVGSDRYDSLVGSPPVGITFSEYALSDPQAWSFLSPIIEENGGFAVFISTPRGKNHFERLYNYARTQPDWFVETLTADVTRVFDPEQLNKIRADLVGLHGEQEGDAVFRQEYYCSFNAAIIGSYYGGLIEQLERAGQICDVPYDQTVPVTTTWDLGIGDSTAVWFFQEIGREIHCIDYYEASGADLGHYVRELQAKPYVYAQHILPHDARARELGTGASRVELLERLGLTSGRLGAIRIAPNLRIEDGIAAVRLMLSRCWFDAERCGRGVEKLRLYRSDYDQKNGVLRPRPVHDHTSHCADAFRMAAVSADFAGAGARLAGFNRRIEMPHLTVA